MKIKSNNLQDTKRIGLIIGKNLKSGSILCLDGDLGAGKTTLTQYIAEQLGVVENITSPTFTIIKEYMGKMPLYHMDVYRIDSEEEMYDLGYEEYIYSDGVTIIEWSHKIINILPAERINVYIDRVAADVRIFNITGNGASYDKIVEELYEYESVSN